MKYIIIDMFDVDSNINDKYLCIVNFKWIIEYRKYRSKKWIVKTASLDSRYFSNTKLETVEVGHQTKVPAKILNSYFLV